MTIHSFENIADNSNTVINFQQHQKYMLKFPHFAKQHDTMNITAHLPSYTSESEIKV